MSDLYFMQATGRMKLTGASLRQTLAQQSLVGLLLAVGLTGEAPLLSWPTQHEHLLLAIKSISASLR